MRTPIEPGHYDDLQKASVPTAAAGFAAVGVVREADVAADAHDAVADVAGHDAACDIVRSELCL